MIRGDKVAEGHHGPADNIVETLPALAAVAVLEGNIVKAYGFGHRLSHLDLLTYSIDKMEAALWPKNGEWYTRESASCAEIQNLSPVARRDKLTYRQRVENMMYINIVDVFSGNDIDLTVPVGIEVAEIGQLLSLAVG